ncbi:MAG: DegT/DnrJ/EryC1/StrS family aminotransferase [Spirochaetales bacterium]|uniref:DegT/DnrJ/EryC1/StrS family aminotransferase n=1 Tax=Candidatus Thalassospirochaeta sargassi TaxID=3119039 RepID=A0AAJ1IFF3_9SPIO|nr:DegT/DnrJ/EryC1/StrS family aminotransferase [Spirochaetales bacterium]
MKHSFLPTEEHLKSEIQEAVNIVIERGDFVLGKESYTFEAACSEYLGAKHCFGLNSGTDAVRFALMALGIGAGDEVLTSPFCFVSNAEAIALEGATPVFADIDPYSFNISPAAVEAAITPRTKAILPIHMYGHPADMSSINNIAAKHGLAVIEDACQAFGSMLPDNSMVGGKSQFAAFSFFHTKPLGAYGDAGMLTTNNDAFAEKIRMLRNHGSRKRYYHDEIGCSSRLDTIQAAVLLTQLKYFDSKIDAVRDHAAVLNQELSGIGDIIIPHVQPGVRHNYNLYTIRTDRRDELLDVLQGKGIKCSVAFPLSIHLQKAFGYLGHSRGDFPESERAQDEILCLTINPYWTVGQIENVVNEIKDFFG